MLDPRATRCGHESCVAFAVTPFGRKENFICFGVNARERGLDPWCNLSQQDFGVAEVLFLVDLTTNNCINHAFVEHANGEAFESSAKHAGLFEQLAEDLALDCVRIRSGCDDCILKRVIEQIGFEARFVFEVRDPFVSNRAKERRLRDVEIAVVDQLTHLAIEEGQKQRADVASVDISVRHDDDFVVARFFSFKVKPDAAAQCRDDGLNFYACEHAIESRPLDV